MLLFCLLLLFFITNNEEVMAKVLGAAVIPHGDFAYDPSLVNNSASAVKLNEACIKLGEDIAKMNPDVVILSTPHGQALDINFAVYGNSLLSGYAPIGQDLHDESHENYDITVTASSNTDLATSLVSAIRDHASSNISLLTSWGDSEPSPLRWAEVIPMSFLNDTLSHTQYIVISHPTRRYSEATAMVDELERVGHAVYNFFKDSPDISAMFIVSSDLAHTHSPTGPYGYSVTANPFDKAVVEWGQSMNEFYLLQKAKILLDAALSCGWTGLVILNGFLKAGGKDNQNFFSNVDAYSCPSYYGMMAARFFSTSEIS